MEHFPSRFDEQQQSKQERYKISIMRLLAEISQISEWAFEELSGDDLYLDFADNELEESVEEEDRLRNALNVLERFKIAAKAAPEVGGSAELRQLHNEFFDALSAKSSGSPEGAPTGDADSDD